MTQGYDFVPLPDRVRRRPRPEARHDRPVENTITGVLRCVWRAEQPVHVGSGFKAFVGDKVAREGARIRGRPGIPGSTLKGVLRARYEAITHSCAPRPVNREKIRSSQEKYQGYKAPFDLRATRHDMFAQCDDTLCPACALFGKMSLRSRVTVEDLVAAEPCGFVVAQMPKQFSPNQHHLGHYRVDQANRLLVVDKLHGRKFAVSPAPPAKSEMKFSSVEAIPADTRFTGKIRFVNLTPQELGGLLVALGRHSTTADVGPIKLGGGKCHDFGRLRLVDLHLAERGAASTAVESPVERDPRLACWLSAFRNDADCDPDGLTRLIAIHGENC